VFGAFAEDDRVSFQRAEPPELEVLWQDFACRHTASPKLWMDAYLAAFAVAGGMALVTTDAAFRQFRGLDLLVLG
jgi:predicted nucleic acid-binding protein